ncbi:MAG: hypothetical protein OXU98_05350 [Gammaproteobacteria bacterium]|nr:hypothetical protein [Gammaproteobacteria bacterium]
MSGGRWSQAARRRLARKRAPHRGGWRVTGRPRRPARWRVLVFRLLAPPARIIDDFVRHMRLKYDHDWPLMLVCQWGVWGLFFWLLACAVVNRWIS